MGKLIVVMATTPTLGCASAGKLPWNRPVDGKWFKSVTTDQVVIQGGKTFDEIVQMTGNPLPNRLNLVLCKTPREVTWDDSFYVKFFTDVGTLVDYVKVFLGTKDVYLIGGQETINQLMGKITIDIALHSVVTKPVDHTPDVFLNIPEFDLTSTTDPVEYEGKGFVVMRRENSSQGLKMKDEYTFKEQLNDDYRYRAYVEFVKSSTIDQFVSECKLSEKDSKTLGDLLNSDGDDTMTYKAAALFQLWNGFSPLKAVNKTVATILIETVPVLAKVVVDESLQTHP